MEMKEMYFGIISKMKGYEPLLKEQEDIVAECEKATEKAMAEQESAEKKLVHLKSKYEALIKMKAAYESAFGLNSEDDITVKETTEEVKPEIEKEKEEVVNMKPKKAKQLTWKHKSARLIKYDRNGTEIGNYATQAAAARAMSWDQSSISRFMKFGKDEQIRKKNFYFAWEY